MSETKKLLKFPDCNCEFEVDNNGGIIFNPDIETLPLDCPRTWSMIQEGNTKGIFQLESRLGQMYAKKLKPESIEHLSALIALIRPGCLEVIVDGKNITQHYIDRKNGEESISYYHEALKSALEKTYAVMCYQEQAMQITRDVANFDLKQADTFRKACGKKLPALMAKVKTEFLEGCKKAQVVTDEEAEVIFSQLEKSQRYSFNKCLCPNTTYVEKPSGERVLIKDIQIGDYIKAPIVDKNKKYNYNDEWVYDKNKPNVIENYPYTYVKVINKYDTGLQQAFKVKLWWMEDEITCTKGHKFLCKDNVIRTLAEIMDKGGQENYGIRCDHRKYDNTGESVGIQGEIDFGDLRLWDVIPTMDIEVDSEDHLYYANNIATSNSHSVSYALNGYLSAYLKAHFPKQFFTSYLTFSGEKPKPQDEVYELVNNAKMMNVDIQVPNIINKNKNFQLIGDTIYFGLLNIKSVGNSVVEKLIKTLDDVEKLLEKPVDKWQWLDFLLFVAPHITSTAVKAIISTGCLSYMGVSRTRMLYEYNKLGEALSDKELLWCQTKYLQNQKPYQSPIGQTPFEFYQPPFAKLERLEDILQLIVDAPTGRKDGCGCSSSKRKSHIEQVLQVLRNPEFVLEDSIIWTANTEAFYLGISLSCNIVDGHTDDVYANSTCKEFLDGSNLTDVISIAVKLDRVSVIRTKKGKNIGAKMAFLGVSDGSCNLDGVVCFPKVYEEYQNLLTENNVVIILGIRGKDKDSFIVNGVKQI